MSWELSLSCLYLEAGKPMIGSLVVTVPLRQVMSWKTGGSSWRPIPCSHAGAGEVASLRGHRQRHRNGESPQWRTTLLSTP